MTVVTGFLGSGKTTLLARLLRHPGLSDAAVIVNEFGEVGLDHVLVERPADETVLLDNGCVCCTMLGDLVVTLQELLARRVAGRVPPFRRVMVETTGMADPVPLVQTLVADPGITRHFALDGVVTVVDGRNGAAQLNDHPQSIKQAAVADRLLVTKTDLVEPGTLAALETRLRAINPGAPVLHVLNGEVSPDEVMGGAGPRGVRAGRLADWLGETVEGVATGDGRHGHDHHGHDDGVRTFTIRLERPVHPAGLNLWLDLVSVFQGPSLLRVKGLVNVAGRPVVINLVQHVAHPPAELDRWPDTDRSSRVVFITKGIGRAAIAPTLGALDFTPSRRGAARAIDRGDYARFRRILEGFHGNGIKEGALR